MDRRARKGMNRTCGVKGSIDTWHLLCTTLYSLNLTCVLFQLCHQCRLYTGIIWQHLVSCLRGSSCFSLSTCVDTALDPHSHTAPLTTWGCWRRKYVVGKISDQWEMGTSENILPPFLSQHSLKTQFRQFLRVSFYRIGSSRQFNSRSLFWLILLVPLSSSGIIFPNKVIHTALCFRLFYLGEPELRDPIGCVLTMAKRSFLWCSQRVVKPQIVVRSLRERETARRGSTIRSINGYEEDNGWERRLQTGQRGQ